MTVRYFLFQDKAVYSFTLLILTDPYCRCQHDSYHSFFTGSIILPVSVHLAMVGVIMFLEGIALGGLENGAVCYY